MKSADTGTKSRFDFDLPGIVEHYDYTYDMLLLTTLSVVLRSVCIICRLVGV